MRKVSAAAAVLSSFARNGLTPPPAFLYCSQNFLTNPGFQNEGHSKERTW